MTVEALSDTRPRVRIVVGLGNPGGRYRRTRHNIGSRVVDTLADAFNIRFKEHEPALKAGYGRIRGRDVCLLKPQAYMNRSGPPVSAFLEEFCISYREILVVHDDIDLEFGRLKIKKKGGDGGHRGIRSMTDACGTGSFARLRLGIGHSGEDVDVVDHVLGQFDIREMEHLSGFINSASEAAVTVLCDGLNAGMNQFNRKRVTNF